MANNNKLCKVCNKEYTFMGPAFFEQDDGSWICSDCNLKMHELTCPICENRMSFYFQEWKGETICGDCYEKEIRKEFQKIIITTTHDINGFKITEYMDIDSIEIVIGTGWFSEFTGEISDILGMRSSQFEKKLQKAKNTAVLLLRKKAYEKGANAVIGVDMDYTEFSGNRVGIILNGTFVNISKI